MDKNHRGIIKQFTKQSISIWESSLKTDFLRAMYENSLEPACLISYLIEDSLYLREYAKLFALAMSRAEDMKTLQFLYSFLSYINEEENTVRIQYLNEYNISIDSIQKLPLRAANKNYIAHMRAAVDRGLVYALMSALPCMLSYSWIFTKMLKNENLKTAYYYKLIEDYASPHFITMANTWSSYTENLYAQLNDEDRESCAKIFYQSSLDELAFWELCGKTRTEIIYDEKSDTVKYQIKQGLNF